MTLFGKSDSLIGCVVWLPVTGRALVLDIEHEYDDGTTLRYLEGPNAGQLTMRDTFLVRRYEVVGRRERISR
jgi:hypothetical protein